MPSGFQLEPRDNCPFSTPWVPSLHRPNLPWLPYAWATSPRHHLPGPMLALEFMTSTGHLSYLWNHLCNLDWKVSGSPEPDHQVYGSCSAPSPLWAAHTSLHVKVFGDTGKGEKSRCLVSWKTSKELEVGDSKSIQTPSWSRKNWSYSPTSLLKTYSSILVWRIPRTEDPGRPQSIHSVPKSRTMTEATQHCMAPQTQHNNCYLSSDFVPIVRLSRPLSES